MLQTTTIIGKEFPEKVIPLIKNAKNSIDIIVYEWRWYPNQPGSTIQKFNNSLIDAVRKNKKIRIITNSYQILKLLEGIKIKTKNLQSKRLLHTKLMIIDNKIAILGSHNYTMNAFNINHEVSVIIQEEQVVKRLKTYFENLWW